MKPEPTGRRGSGRTMALMLGAQLTAATGKTVAVFLYSPTRNGDTTKWLHTLHPEVAKRINVFHECTVQDVQERLRGCRFGAVLVDHALFDKTERDLEARIQAMRDGYKRDTDGLETIR